MNKNLPIPGELKQMDQKALDHVVSLHKRFMKGQRGGIRAILKFVDVPKASERVACTMDEETGEKRYQSPRLEELIPQVRLLSVSVGFSKSTVVLVVSPESTKGKEGI